MKETLRLLAFVGLILLFPAMALLITGKVKASSERFEIQAEEWYQLAEGGNYMHIYAIHDKGSGIELVCVQGPHGLYSGDDLSCTLTGRNWK